MYWTRIAPGHYRVINSDVTFEIRKESSSRWQVWHGTATQPLDLITFADAKTLQQAQALADKIFGDIKTQMKHVDKIIYFTLSGLNDKLYGMAHNWEIIPLDNQQSYTSRWTFTNSAKTYMEGYGNIYKRGATSVKLVVYRDEEFHREILKAHIDDEGINYSVMGTGYDDEEWQWLPGHMANLSNAAWLTHNAIKIWRDTDE